MNREWKSFKRVALLSVVLALGACGKDGGNEPPVEEPQVFQGEGNVGATEPHSLRFTLRANRLYRFDCTAVVMLGCKVQLRDGVTLEPIGAPWNSGTQVRKLIFFWRQATAGDVVLDIQSAAEGQGGAFSYELRETQDDAGDAPEQAVPQTVTQPGAPFSGFLEHAEDVDFWRISIPADHTLSVGCFGLMGSDVKPAIELIRPDGTSLSADRAAWFQSLGVGFLAAKNAGGGDILLRVRASGPYEANSAPYQCIVEDTGVDDLGDTPSEATVVTVPAEVRVRFGNILDVDVLAVDLVQGHDYQLLTASEWGAPPFYTATRVADAQGTLVSPKLASDTEGATFTAPTTGRYFLALTWARGDGLWKWDARYSFTYKITDVTP